MCKVTGARGKGQTTLSFPGHIIQSLAEIAFKFYIEVTQAFVAQECGKYLKRTQSSCKGNDPTSQRLAMLSIRAIVLTIL